MRNVSDKRIAIAQTRCYYCGGDHDLVMNTRLSENAAEKVDALNGKVTTMEPCRECKKLMEQGVVFITIDPDKSGEGWDEAHPQPSVLHLRPHHHSTGGLGAQRPA